MNDFTVKLYNNGWLVKDFLEYWEISRKTWERHIADKKWCGLLHKQIDAMGVKSD